MSEPRDLFPGFASHWIDTEAGQIFARSGGSGPPLLLLHGYPQTHVEWHAVAGKLAERFTVVMMDLRGYGWSRVVESENGSGYAKQLMAEDAVAVMEALGHVKFRVVGHDRGARVAYRMAFDMPERLEKFATIDIIPTAAMFDGMNARSALNKYHWLFLAQPAPFPETMIGNSVLYYLEHTLASWTAKKSLAPFSPEALARYRMAFNEPSRIHATCEDYRAGATLDRAHDEADREAGRKIAVPLLALWGASGIPSAGVSPLDVWRDWARDVRGHAIESGHFVPEENPVALLEALFGFL
jgi:haloacetate dehalogenase